ncbi:MAG: DUF3427 domain-containing protein, partial [Deltaproteobacteria bacterium]|nr:DUF3427 domain-containing protein [Deltaproteobacteria bacterium]
MVTIDTLCQGLPGQVSVPTPRAAARYLSWRSGAPWQRCSTPTFGRGGRTVTSACRRRSARHSTAAPSLMPMLYPSGHSSASSTAFTRRSIASIAYHDYAISPELFHWQTQNNVGPDTPAGRRYMESPQNGWRFFLFLRERKDAAYCALGPASKVHIEGDRP